MSGKTSPLHSSTPTTSGASNGQLSKVSFTSTGSLSHPCAFVCVIQYDCIYVSGFPALSTSVCNAALSGVIVCVAVEVMILSFVGVSYHVISVPVPLVDAVIKLSGIFSISVINHILSSGVGTSIK